MFILYTICAVIWAVSALLWFCAAVLCWNFMYFSFFVGSDLLCFVFFLLAVCHNDKKRNDKHL